MASMSAITTTISTRDGIAFASLSAVVWNAQRSRLLWQSYGSTSPTRPIYRACTRTSAAVTGRTNKYKQPKKKSRARSVQPKYVRRTGMNTPVLVSKELRECIGGDEMSNRSQILASLSKYVRENNMYVDSDKKRILCDEQLSSLLNIVGELDFWDAFRLLKPHLTDPSDLGPEYESRAKDFFEKYLKEKGALASWHKPDQDMDPRGRNSAAAQKRLKEHRRGMYAEVCVEARLLPLCDGKSRLSRPQVLKSVWAYIKKHQLQDATNGRRIRVTQTLRDALRLPDVEWIDSFRLGSYIFKSPTSEEEETPNT